MDCSDNDYQCYYDFDVLKIKLRDIRDIVIDTNNCDKLCPCSHRLSITINATDDSCCENTRTYHISTPIKAPEIIYYLLEAKIAIPDHLKKYVSSSCYECDDFEYIYDKTHPCFSYKNLVHYDSTYDTLCFKTTFITIS